MRPRAMLALGLGGALGGAVNAWLCYAGIPVPVEHKTFTWQVIPAGAVHGAVLAVVALGLGTALSRRPVGLRLLAALPVAWAAGYLSWIPLAHVVFEWPWSKSLTWPLHDGWGSTLLEPLRYFGFVTLLYFAAVAFWLARGSRPTAHAALAVIAGCLGSLWWWIEIEPWYFSVLHGAIWGAFVGAGAWASGSPGRESSP